MLKFKPLAGDFRMDGQHQFVVNTKTFHFQKQGWRPGLEPNLAKAFWAGFSPEFEEVPLSEIESFELASEESVKKIWGTVAGGAIGLAILGPLGLLAGVLTGGNRKEVVWMCRFKDGRKLMAKSKNKTYEAIQAALF